MKSEGKDDEVDQGGFKAVEKKQAKNKADNHFQAHRMEEPDRSTEDDSTKKTTGRRRLGDEIVAQPEWKGSKKNKKDTRPDDDAPTSGGKGKGKKNAVQLDKEDMEECTLGQGSSTNKATLSNAGKKTSETPEDEDRNEDIQVKNPVTSKTPLKKNKPVAPMPPSKARKKTVGISGDEDSDNEDIQVEPVSAKVPSKKKKPTMTPIQNMRSQTAPPQSSISGFSFNNTGTGTMSNRDVGNIYQSTISDVGNDNSVNYFQARRKPTNDRHL